MYDFRKYSDTVLQHAKPLPLPVDLQHAGLGIVSEAGEICDALKAHMIYGKDIDPVNIKEEAGDVMWFTSLLAKLLRFDIQELGDGVGRVSLAPAGVIGASFRLAFAASSIAVELDAFAQEGRTLRLPSLSLEMRRCMTELARLGCVYDFTLGDACESNIVKLALRYKGKGFDADLGLNRDKAAERTAMAETTRPILGARSASKRA